MATVAMVPSASLHTVRRSCVAFCATPSTRPLAARLICPRASACMAHGAASFILGTLVRRTSGLSIMAAATCRVPQASQTIWYAVKGFACKPVRQCLEPIDLSQPFGGFNHPLSLAPLSRLSPLKPEFDTYQTRHSFLDYSFQSSDLGSLDLRSSITSSCSAEALNAVSPRSASSTESATSKFSRLTIFQRICRENE